MNRDVLAAAGIEWDKGVTCCMDNAALYEKSLRGFMEDPKLEEALELFRIQDHERLMDCAGEIKAVCSGLGMGQIGQAAGQVTEAIRRKDQAALSGAMNRMEEAYRSALAALTQVLGEGKA